LPDGVELRSIFKVAPFAQPLPLRQSEMKIGFVEARTPLVILLELVIEPQPIGRRLQLGISLIADIPSRKQPGYLVNHGFDVVVVDGEPLVNPSDSMIDAVQAWNFYEMNEQAWDDIEAGNLEKAKTRLSRLTNRLREAGHTKMAQKVATESKMLMATGKMTAAGRKTLKFGTRSLVAETTRFNEMVDGQM
jgi:hypothetical protein